MPPHNDLRSCHVTLDVNGLAAVPLRCAFGSAPVTPRGPRALGDFDHRKTIALLNAAEADAGEL